jgi:hypothetical protein
MKFPPNRLLSFYFTTEKLTNALHHNLDLILKIIIALSGFFLHFLFVIFLLDGESANYVLRRTIVVASFEVSDEIFAKSNNVPGVFDVDQMCLETNGLGESVSLFESFRNDNDDHI